MLQHEQVPPLDPGATPIADDKERHDPIVDGLERIEVDPVGPADEDARRVAEYPHVPLRHAVRLQVSFDPLSRRSLLDASKNLGRRGLLWQHPESDRREVNDVQAGRSGWNATGHDKPRRRPEKLLVHEQENVSGDGADVETSVTLTGPHARGAVPRSMNGDHVWLMGPGVAGKPNPAPLKRFAPDGETQDRKTLLLTEDALLEGNPLGADLRKEKIAKVACLTRKRHRLAGA